MLKEYIRFLPYAVVIAGFFLMEVIDPPTISSEEMFNREESEEQIREASNVRGGEIMDREVAHQIKEMLELSQRYNIALDENIDVSNWINDAKLFIK